MAESLATLQRRWADHVRDPSMAAPDGIEARRLAVYRRLCIDSLDTLLAGSLPRLQHQLGMPRWRDTVEHYYASHTCRTPLFPQIAGEFAAWLAMQDAVALPAWAAELAHYESTQQSLHIEARAAGRSLHRVPVDSDVLAVSPLVQVLGYRWPVHVDEMLEPMLDAAPTLLLMRRTPEFSLRVEELAPLAYAVLLAFGDDGTRVDDVLQTVAEAHGVAPDELRAACIPVLRDLCKAGVLVASTDPGGGRRAAATTPSPFFEA
ncbi:putative DNA-binding domain-containing protein [Stenotrophomonas sp. TWI1409]|uniref:HvfC family RiPP maturation protein n=1 Tax=Stenotrophomonas sp. TWI1409 TaxID=3136802 RepID=UPI0032084946